MKQTVAPNFPGSPYTNRRVTREARSTVVNSQCKSSLRAWPESRLHAHVLRSHLFYTAYITWASQSDECIDEMSASLSRLWRSPPINPPLGVPEGRQGRRLHLVNSHRVTHRNPFASTSCCAFLKRCRRRLASLHLIFPFIPAISTMIPRLDTT